MSNLAWSLSLREHLQCHRFGTTFLMGILSWKLNAALTGVALVNPSERFPLVRRNQSRKDKLCRVTTEIPCSRPLLFTRKFDLTNLWLLSARRLRCSLDTPQSR